MDRLRRDYASFVARENICTVKKAIMDNRNILQNALRRGNNNNGYNGIGPRNPVASNAFTSLWGLIGQREKGYQGMNRQNNGSVTLRFNAMSHLNTHMRKIQLNESLQNAVKLSNKTWYVRIPKEYVEALNLPKNVNNNVKGASKWSSITNSIPSQYRTVFNESMALVYAQHLKTKSEAEQKVYLNSIGQLIPGMIEYFDRLL